MSLRLGQLFMLKYFRKQYSLEMNSTGPTTTLLLQNDPKASTFGRHALPSEGHDKHPHPFDCPDRQRSHASFSRKHAMTATTSEETYFFW